MNVSAVCVTLTLTAALCLSVFSLDRIYEENQGLKAQLERDRAALEQLQKQAVAADQAQCLQQELQQEAERVARERLQQLQCAPEDWSAVALPDDVLGMFATGGDQDNSGRAARKPADRDAGSSLATKN